MFPVFGLTLLVVLFIRDTSLRVVVPYVDPVLVLLVSGITIGVPIRMAWGSLMELLNRTPSPELLSQVKAMIQDCVQELPVEQVSIRVLQPGRTRIISAHVLLSEEFSGKIGHLDRVREKTHAVLTAEHPASVVDLIFTCDPRWSAPLETDHL